MDFTQRAAVARSSAKCLQVQPAASDRYHPPQSTSTALPSTNNSLDPYPIVLVDRNAPFQLASDTPNKQLAAIPAVMPSLRSLFLTANWEELSKATPEQLVELSPFPFGKCTASAMERASPGSAAAATISPPCRRLKMPAADTVNGPGLLPAARHETLLPRRFVADCPSQQQFLPRHVAAVLTTERLPPLPPPPVQAQSPPSSTPPPLQPTPPPPQEEGALGRLDSEPPCANVQVIRYQQKYVSINELATRRDLDVPPLHGAVNVHISPPRKRCGGRSRRSNRNGCGGGGHHGRHRRCDAAGTGNDVAMQAPPAPAAAGNLTTRAILIFSPPTDTHLLALPPPPWSNPGVVMPKSPCCSRPARAAVVPACDTLAAAETAARDMQALPPRDYDRVARTAAAEAAWPATHPEAGVYGGHDGGWSASCGSAVGGERAPTQQPTRGRASYNNGFTADVGKIGLDINIPVGVWFPPSLGVRSGSGHDLHGWVPPGAGRGSGSPGQDDIPPFRYVTRPSQAAAGEWGDPRGTAGWDDQPLAAKDFVYGDVLGAPTASLDAGSRTSPPYDSDNV